MLRSVLAVSFVVFVTLSSAAPAQEQPSPPRPTPPRTPVASAPAPPPSLNPLEPPRRTRGKDVNVQVELTITDQTGAAPAEKKTVSLLAADQTFGRVRANAETTKPTLGRVGTNLNVDARPTLLEGDRILLELTLEYTPLRDSDVVRPTTLNESLTVILTNGKPITISQAADPIADRRMTVEVRATIAR